MLGGLVLLTVLSGLYGKSGAARSHVDWLSAELGALYTPIADLAGLSGLVSARRRTRRGGGGVDDEHNATSGIFDGASERACAFDCRSLASSASPSAPGAAGDSFGLGTFAAMLCAHAAGAVLVSRTGLGSRRRDGTLSSADAKVSTMGLARLQHVDTELDAYLARGRRHGKAETRQRR
jgi:hypothetical protein